MCDDALNVTKIKCLHLSFRDSAYFVKRKRERAVAGTVVFLLLLIAKA